jgi:hypothetical protein
MRQIVFLAAASLGCVVGVSAQQHNIDTQKSTLTNHVGKTGGEEGGRYCRIIFIHSATLRRGRSVADG